jgi:exonuclease III
MPTRGRSSETAYSNRDHTATQTDSDSTRTADGQASPFRFEPSAARNFSGIHSWNDVLRSAQVAHRRRRFNATAVNINGLLKTVHTEAGHTTAFTILLAEAKVRRWDVILVSETHLHTESDRAHARRLAGKSAYNSYFSDTSGGGAHDGTAVLWRKNKLIDELLTWSPQLSAPYAVIGRITVQGAPWTVGCLYLSNCPTTRRTQLDTVKSTLLREGTQVRILIGGDFNGVLDPSIDSENGQHADAHAGRSSQTVQCAADEVELFSITLGCVDAFRRVHPGIKSYTHFMTNRQCTGQTSSARRLDRIWIKVPASSRVNAEHLRWGFSDHALVVVGVDPTSSGAKRSIPFRLAASEDYRTEVRGLAEQWRCELSYSEWIKLFRVAQRRIQRRSSPADLPTDAKLRWVANGIIDTLQNMSDEAVMCMEIALEWILAVYPQCSEAVSWGATDGYEMLKLGRMNGPGGETHWNPSRTAESFLVLAVQLGKEQAVREEIQRKSLAAASDGIQAAEYHRPYTRLSKLLALSDRGPLSIVQDESGSELEGPEALEYIARFYEQLYCTSAPLPNMQLHFGALFEHEAFTPEEVLRMDMTSVTVEEVARIITQAPNSKAAGPDGIPWEAWKQSGCAGSFSSPI